jgi:hypothetical protein
MAPQARVHHFHGEAHVFEAELQHPLTGDIKPQNHVKLLPEGGYILEHAKDYRADNIVTFKSAHTHVAGHKSPKEGHGWITLTTSVIEGLNVLEVVTADRVVAQTSTEHPLEGHVPTVTFLGTRFENLRLAGVSVNVSLKFPFTALKPPGPDVTHLNDASFLREIGCPDSFPNVQSQWEAYLKDEAYIKNNEGRKAELRPNGCAKGSLAYDVSLGGRKFPANVIEIPEFGKIFLAELAVECDTFRLTMIRLDMGCLAKGTASFAINIANGQTSP